ncbi:FAD-dependent oxidoreductase [Brevundimonas sp. SL130]|uniref:FAD-dependent oxidoreductase n=1 Tax=Brevundimonas sp. SL130 TaxID=2995143 RepID=UPI00226C80C3|nr:NAD(P)/FAD-dependent oxidoreductase [Brevundimonas sp. SL130]WAC60436.1 NAD(P)/FAD-dependent oxidoreductase [Brevundimonas sp. SL130]
MTAIRDIAVAGAGPTGLAVALMLARQGRRVVVFERFDTAQPVGAGFMLQPTGLAVLDALGLTPAIQGLGQPIDHIFGRAAPSGRVVLDVRYSDLKRPRQALGVHRSAIFHVLHQACLEAGVQFELAREATAASLGRLSFADGSTSPAFDLVVDATGARSPIAAVLAQAQGSARRDLAYGALWTTTPWPVDPHFDERALQQVYRGAAKMVGVLPVGVRPGSPDRLATFFWSLKAQDHDVWVRQGLEAWKAEVRALWPETAALLETIGHTDDLVLARYGHHTLARPVADRLAVVGDAAHSTSPQLGQGVNMGLLDAHALCWALQTHADLDTALSAYAQDRRWHLRLYQALSLGFTPFYQADGRLLPWIRDHVLGKAARLPFAPRLLAATVSGLLLDPRRTGCAKSLRPA